MVRLYLLFISLSLSFGQTSYINEIKSHRNKLNTTFSDPDRSPLLMNDLKNFKSLDFFEINPIWRIKATFKRTAHIPSFAMKTTTDRLPIYDKYGEVTFEYMSKTFTVSVYQSHRLRNTKKYKNHLFFPFLDQTNGKTTYPGGRYIDLEVPLDKEIILDFNKAYNPYCAYNPKYSCPIPPKENQLNLEITAGEKYKKR